MDGAGDVRSASPVSGGLRGGATLVRLLVGAHLRRLREAADVTAGQAAWVAGCGAREMELLERGRAVPRHDVVDALLTRYGVRDEADRRYVFGLVRDADEPGWWHRYGEVLPGWLELFAGLEQGASSIRGYEVQFVPGLLQTEPYARAVIEHGGFTAAEVDARVELRMRRRQVLRGDDPPDFWAIVEEATLRRCVGDRHVMRGQLEHLLALTARPNVAVQVVPFALSGGAAVGGAFTLMRFGEPDLPDVVYLEQLTSAVYLEKHSEVETYRALIDRLGAVALTPRRSAELIAAVAEDW